MEGIVYFQALILGILEGLTEFIPVSSTGHLILLVDLIGFEGPKGAVFEIAIQMGAILAVCFVYKQRLTTVACTLNQKNSQDFVLKLLIAFLPAAVIGFFAHSFIKGVLFNPWVVSYMLIIGGVIILFIERLNIKPKYKSMEEITYKTALAIGFMQCLAMIPGTSRSGATIMGAMVIGTERKTATEFSFFLAIPTMLGATVYDIYKNADHLNADAGGLIAVGFISAFLAAILVVKTVISFINKHGFAPFAYYRIVIGSGMLILLNQ
jgi:undecaprenyl-diphosphatase